MIEPLSFVAGLFIGLGLGWYQFHPRKPKKKQHGMRTVRYDYTPSVIVEPTVDEEQWAVYLAAFALQASYLPRPSERAVVEAGIVDGPSDYRTYARLLRQLGVWSARGRRYPTRWLDRHPRRGVGRLRVAILSGRVRPRWPSPTPPPVYADLLAVSHAREIAD